MGKKSEKFRDDVIFVFDETERIMTQLREGLHPLSKRDIFYDLPLPTGRGNWICGYEAGKRIEGLAEEVLRRQKMENRVALSTAYNATRDALTKYFLQEGRDIDISQVDRAINVAGKAVASSCKTRTHYLPCHLMATKDPDKIEMGPVTFRQQSSFRKYIVAKSCAYRNEGTADRRGWRRKLLSDAIKYYRNFQWVAEVEIENCDEKISESIAKRTVTSALDCLHILFGGESTDRMRVGGPGLSKDVRGQFIEMDTGELYVSSSWGSMGQAEFRAGWSTVLEQSKWQDHLRLCGVALEAIVNPDHKRPVSRRFLDAANWLGEAARETYPAAKIVKYVTALERMVMTDEKDDIATLVSERVSALSAAFGMIDDRDACRKNAKHIYDLRSRLVHGNLSPTAAEVRRGCGLAAKLGSATLLSALHALGEEALRHDNVKTRQLAAWYDKVVRYPSEQNS